MADKEERVEVKITGDSAEAETATRKAADAIGKSVSDMKSAMSSLEGGVGAIKGVFGGFFAMIAAAGVTAMAQLAAKFADNVEKTRDLSRNLGITTNTVAGLEAALDDVGATTEDYTSAAKGLQKQLLNNEAGLKAMGLVTRDAAGNLRPLNDLTNDGIALLNTYKEGTDRNIASMSVFGKGIESGSRLLLLNAETLENNRKAAAELGLEVGLNATAAWEAYDSASDRAELGMKGIGKVIGETVIPVVTTLLNMFNSVAPAAITVLRGALGGLVTAFLALRNGIAVVWELLNAMVVSVAEPIRALGEAIGRSLVGDFKGAGEALKNIPTVVKDAWNTAYNEILASSDKTSEEIGRIWNNAAGDNGGAGNNGGTAGTRSAKTKEPKKEKLDSRMGEWEAQLAERKIAYQKENDLREMSKEDELAYWAALAAMANVNARERVELRKKTSSTELEILKAQRQEQQQLSEEAIAAYRAAQLDGIEVVRQEAQFKVDTQRMTQLELLTLEQDLENQRYQILREAIQSRLTLLEKDPTKNVVALQKLNDELAQVEREHSLKQRGIQIESQKEQLKDWQGLFGSIGSAFGNVVSGLVTRTMTLGQAVKGLFQGLLSSVGNFLGQMVAKKVAAWAMEKVMATGQIATNAAVAGSGAAASQASIPIVGPGLALAAMAAVFAAVMGLGGGGGGGKTPSARDGWNIPSGVNPVTQLHEKEMVLDEENADTIRGLKDGGGTIVLYTQGGDFIHKNDLGRLLKKMGRQFVFKD